MRAPINGHAGLKMTLQPQQIVQGNRDYVPTVPSLQQLTNNRFDLKDVLAFIASDKNTEYGIQVPFLPSQKLRISVDTAKAAANGWISPRFRAYATPNMDWDLPKSYMFKNDLAMLDIIQNNIERPIYFTVSMPTEQYCGLEKYFQVEGLAYRLVPVNFQASQGEIGLVEPDIMFNNMTKKFVFGNMNGKQHGPIYIDPETLRMTINLRQNYIRVADALISYGDNKRAIAALDKMELEMPHPIVPMDGRLVLREVDSYYRAGANDQALKKIESFFNWIGQDLTYYGTTSAKDQIEIYKDEINLQNYILNSMLQLMESHGQKAKADSLRVKMNGWMGKLSAAIAQQ
jgi:tetratricopeptide (TPR) repeat protein